MPMLERLELAKALASKYGKRLTDVEDWRPLLRYTQGNPLTITVVVGQALRDNLTTKAQIEAYVERLKAGEAAFEDEESEGRTKSLGASLSYGFSHTFSDEERAQLALLHLFQGFVHVTTLRLMGHSDEEWRVPVVCELTHEAGIALLDRAAEVGLLTALGGGYYIIHPALPWYFKGLFDQYYGDDPIPPTRAFVEVMGALGNLYSNRLHEGNSGIIYVLTAEEDNFLRARQLSISKGWWENVIGTMQGLRGLYLYTSRNAEWKRLVEEIMPYFVDLSTDDPVPGREDDWSVVTQFRIHLADYARQWSEVERLLQTTVERNRASFSALLAIPPEELDERQRYSLRVLGASLADLGDNLREQGKSECIAVYKERYELALRLGDKLGATVSSFNLGHAYKDVPVVRDLDEAERWYRRSLELRTEQDKLGRSKCYSQLGLVAYERFKVARAAHQPVEELSPYLNAALQYYYQGLRLTPPEAQSELAIDHNQLGNIYDDGGNLELAFLHWRESIRYGEAHNDVYGVAITQFNIAVALLRWHRLDETMLYAQAALRNFQNFGPGAEDDIQETQKLIAYIETLKNEQTTKPAE
jgi:tetratricopeptide (TPR) repeat protein